MISSDVNGETVMMSLELQEYYVLNPIASEIWERLAQPVTVAQVVQDMLESYDGDPATIKADVQALLDDFAKKGLLTIAE